MYPLQPSLLRPFRLEDFPKMKVLGCAGSVETVKEPVPGWMKLS